MENSSQDGASSSIEPKLSAFGSLISLARRAIHATTELGLGALIGAILAPSEIKRALHARKQSRLRDQGTQAFWRAASSPKGLQEIRDHWDAGHPLAFHAALLCEQLVLDADPTSAKQPLRQRAILDALDLSQASCSAGFSLLNCAVEKLDSIRISHATGLRALHAQSGQELRCNRAIHTLAGNAFFASALPSLSLRWNQERLDTSPENTSRLDLLLEDFCLKALCPYDIDLSEPLSRCHPEFLTDLLAALHSRQDKHPSLHEGDIAMTERAIMLSMVQAPDSPQAKTSSRI